MSRPGTGTTIRISASLVDADAGDEADDTTATGRERQ
jgi:hypothetical protein